MITREQLDTLSNTGIQEIDKSKLIGIQKVKIDTSLPCKQRLEDFIQQVKNPYAFRSGSITVLLRFQPDGQSFSQALAGYFQSQQNTTL